MDPSISTPRVRRHAVRLLKPKHLFRTPARKAYAHEQYESSRLGDYTYTVLPTQSDEAMTAVRDEAPDQPRHCPVSPADDNNGRAPRGVLFARILYEWHSSRESVSN